MTTHKCDTCKALAKKSNGVFVNGVALFKVLRNCGAYDININDLVALNATEGV